MDPHYLPHWSSRVESAATWEVRDGETSLRLGGGADAGHRVGIGVHRFRDPELVEEFSAERFDLDVREFHRYGVDRRPDGLTFSIDGTGVRRGGGRARPPRCS